MSRRTSKPFCGVVFGWEREAAESGIGFMRSADPPARRAGRGAANTLVTDESEAHVLVVAPTGAGKGRSLMIPTLLVSHAPAVVIDVKGEAAAVTARARRAMGHAVHIIDPFRIVTKTPDTLNPLDVLDPAAPTFEDDALEIAEAIIGPEGSHRDRFWDNWARSMISVLIGFVASDDKEEGSLGQVWSWVNGGEIEYKLAALLDSGRPKGLAFANIAGFLGLPERDTRPAVLGTTQQHVRLFGTPVVREAMARTSFDLTALRDGRPQTIYLVVPPDKLASHAPMVRLWLWALMSMVIRRETNPPVPTLFIIDEMGHLGPMHVIEQSVTLMRGYGVRLMLLLQNLGQIAKLYPNDHGTIASNCLIASAFGLTNALMARQVADYLGDMSADQLLAMPDDVLAFRRRKGPTRLLRKLDYLKDRRFAGLFDVNRRYGDALKGRRSPKERQQSTSPWAALGIGASAGRSAELHPTSVTAAFREAREARAKVRHLQNRVETMRRMRRLRHIEAYTRKLDAARVALGEAEAKVRGAVPVLFTPSQCELELADSVTKSYGPGRARVTVHGGREDGLVRLDVEVLATGGTISVRCRPEDVNVSAFLIVNGEHALAGSDPLMPHDNDGLPSP